MFESSYKLFCVSVYMIFLGYDFWLSHGYKQKKKKKKISYMPVHGICSKIIHDDT